MFYVVEQKIFIQQILSTKHDLRASNHIQRYVSPNIHTHFCPNRKGCSCLLARSFKYYLFQLYSICMIMLTLWGVLEKTTVHKGSVNWQNRIKYWQCVVLVFQLCVAYCLKWTHPQEFEWKMIMRKVPVGSSRYAAGSIPCKEKSINKQNTLQHKRCWGGG